MRRRSLDPFLEPQERPTAQPHSQPNAGSRCMKPPQAAALLNADSRF